MIFIPNFPYNRDDSNEISSTTERPSSVLPNRFSGKKTDEACQKYTKIAIPFAPSTVLNGREAQLAEYPHMVGD